LISFNKLKDCAKEGKAVMAVRLTSRNIFLIVRFRLFSRQDYGFDKMIKQILVKTPANLA
jgi:hypothetical protein